MSCVTQIKLAEEVFYVILFNEMNGPTGLDMLCWSVTGRS